MVLVKHGTSAREKRRAREQKGSGESRNVVNSPRFQCGFARSRALKPGTWGAMCDEDRHTITCSLRCVRMAASRTGRILPWSTS